MIKSELQIRQDVYDMLKDNLKSMIKGNVYKKGSRPIDAQTEDAVISVSDASADQIQLGHVQINVYVPNIGTSPDDTKLTDLSKKHEYLCELMNEMSTYEYNFYPGRAARMIEEPDINQSFVNFEIEFERITFNDN